MEAAARAFVKRVIYNVNTVLQLKYETVIDQQSSGRADMTIKSSDVIILAKVKAKDLNAAVTQNILKLLTTYQQNLAKYVHLDDTMYGIATISKL
jgi:ribosome-associated translation inhibitor RaiA